MLLLGFKLEFQLRRLEFLLLLYIVRVVIKLQLRDLQHEKRKKKRARSVCRVEGLGINTKRVFTFLHSAVIKSGSYERSADAGVTRVSPGLKQFD